MAPTPFALGDPCTRCGGTMAAVRVPTDEQYRKAFDKETGAGLPDGYDTASPEQRAELGPLYTCAQCGMNYRFGPDATPAKKTKKTDAAA